MMNEAVFVMINNYKLGNQKNRGGPWYQRQSRKQ